MIQSLIGKASAIPHWAVALLARLGLAGIFWRSGQTKVDDWEITEGTIDLFAEEYQVPLLSPELAAYMATTAELLVPIMLVIGLGTRIGALALLSMTVVIQLFVYPMSWPDHMMWAAALAYILSRGPGCASLDHLVAKRFAKD